MQNLQEKLLDGEQQMSESHTIYDTKESFYCQLARMACYENGVPYKSHYLNMQKQEHLAPFMARNNPNMELPAMQRPDGQWFCGSREITAEIGKNSNTDTPEVEALLDKLYEVEIGTFAWTTGAHSITLLGIMMKKKGLEVFSNKIKELQRENPDLHDVYERKLERIYANKDHLKKDWGTIVRQFDQLLREMSEMYEKNQALDKDNWLINTSFTRADQMACIWLQWVVWSSEYKRYVNVPPPLMEFLARTSKRESFKLTLTQHGSEGFVLNKINRINTIAGCVLAAVILGATAGAAWFILA